MVRGNVGLRPAGLLATIDFEFVKFFTVKNKCDLLFILYSLEKSI